ncbi:hypothetical protein [Acetilactobacillus jinshanensis]|uniref:DUF2768 domain-containing protein n=1 Tax=Acetilactobacillus jinshanensis TaxID=1720083 RepID=A0A4P6ZMJ4_9LACO|nr:hypothetical protein [Acetilactobacillus jinshanensis]QBP18948.1 hypothetical protein ELX58_07645 [Acetilactobacillus jinshanensis]URL60502.1 hypothetical protein HGK75_00150 [uncultured bacterium]
MISADFAVQIKLIIMYTIGLLALIATFIYLHHITRQWITKFSLSLLAVIIIMAIILFITVKLP